MIDRSDSCIEIIREKTVIRLQPVSWQGAPRWYACDRRFGIIAPTIGEAIGRLKQVRDAHARQHSA